MPPKDRSKEPPDTVDPSPTPAKRKRSDDDWPRLLARLVEGIVTAELHEFEDNVMAFLDSAVADAYAAFVWICARLIGAALLLTALVLFLGIFFQWWAVFGLLGVVVIAMGALARLMRRTRKVRTRR
jgi:hypothetical protein